MWEYNYTDELEHHGILGQKWGIRRFQRKDGTLTKSGLKRKAKLEKQYEEMTGKNLKRVNAAAKARAAKAAKKEGSKEGSKVNQMSDDELRRAVQRLNLEKQYKELTKKPQSKGQYVVNKFKNKLIDDTVDIANTQAKKYIEKAVESLLSSSKK